MDLPLTLNEVRLLTWISYTLLWCYFIVLGRRVGHFVGRRLFE